MNRKDAGTRLKWLVDVFGISIQAIAHAVSRDGKRYSRSYVSRIVHGANLGSSEFYISLENVLPNIIRLKTKTFFPLESIALDDLTKITPTESARVA